MNMIDRYYHTVDMHKTLTYPHTCFNAKTCNVCQMVKIDGQFRIAGLIDAHHGELKDNFDDPEFVITNSGHSGPGVYVYDKEYPEDGSVFLMTNEELVKAGKEKPIKEVIYELEQEFVNLNTKSESSISYIVPRRFQIVDNATLLSMLRDARKLMEGDLSYDNRAQAREILDNAMARINDKLDTLIR